MSEIEMNTFEGQCKYCGNIQPIMAMDQVDADEQISESCECGGAERERRKAALMQSLEDTIGKNAASNGFRQVDQEQEEDITNMALAVFHGRLKAASVKIGGSTINIVATNDRVHVRRTDTKKLQLEA